MFHFTSHVILCCLFVAPLSFAGNLKITQRTTTPGFQTTRTTYVQRLRTREESQLLSRYQAWRGGPWVSHYGRRFAGIYQCDTKRAILMDTDAHEYMIGELDDRGRIALTAAASMPSLPLPEPSGGVLSVYLNDVDTGERKNVFGYTARHVVRTEK